MTEWANQDAVDEAASSWTAGQLRCRSSRNHQWNPLTVVRRRGSVWLEVTERCGKCKNERRTNMHSETGLTTGWRMRYVSENYLLPKKSGRLSPVSTGRLRLRTLDSYRLIEVDDEAD